jgi:hypothetical protein
MDSPLILTAFERCPCAAYFARSWKLRKYDEIGMIQHSLRAGFTTTCEDHGQEAGDACYELGKEPGLDTEHFDVHGQVVHLATLSDILATAIRKKGEKPWLFPEPIELTSGIWNSGAYLSPDGLHLRRVALVSGWSDDRHYSEARSWRTLGEICMYGLPMQQVVCVIGQSRSGKRHSWWTHGLRHPLNKKLRFRKKNQLDQPFKTTWREVWREEYDDITTQEWLAAMIEDDVLKDACFRVDVPVPEKVSRQRIIDLAQRKLEAVMTMREKPDQNLSTCDWPVVCSFRSPCHSGNQPSVKYGFVKVSSLGGDSAPVR